MVAPIVEEVASQYEGQVKVVKLDTDKNPSIASQYGIRSIPTLIVFKGGQQVDLVVGAVPKNHTLQHLGKVFVDRRNKIGKSQQPTQAQALYMHIFIMLNVQQ